MQTEANWYDRRDELEHGMVFESCWGVVRLDHRVPGDGTKWYVANRSGNSWSYEDGTIEPGDLETRLPELEGK